MWPLGFDSPVEIIEPTNLREVLRDELAVLYSAIPELDQRGWQRLVKKLAIRNRILAIIGPAQASRETS